MALIDPEGLFCGERLAACSDMAQLYWPRLFLASNGYARIELNYDSIVRKVFQNFQNPPKPQQIWAYFKEYEENFLAVLYKNGPTWWCQFDTQEKFLPTYKTRRDKDSPGPPEELICSFRLGYEEWKRKRANPAESFQKFSEDFSHRGIGEVNGVGEEEDIGKRLIV